MVPFLKGRKSGNNKNHSGKPVIPPEAQSQTAKGRWTRWFRNTHGQRQKILKKEKEK